MMEWTPKVRHAGTGEMGDTNRHNGRKPSDRRTVHLFWTQPPPVDEWLFASQSIPGSDSRCLFYGGANIKVSTDTFLY
jgi:hypothetical protein